MGKKKGATKKGDVTPIFVACEYDEVGDLKALLKSDPKLLISRNRDGWTPLHQAAFMGSLECVEVLLAAGADIKVVCNDRCHPVHYASAQGHLDVIRVLVMRKGGAATLTAADNDGEDAFDVALNAKVKKALEKIKEEAEEAEGEGDEAAEEKEEGEEAEEGDE